MMRVFFTCAGLLAGLGAARADMGIPFLSSPRPITVGVFFTTEREHPGYVFFLAWSESGLEPSFRLPLGPGQPFVCDRDGYGFFLVAVPEAEAGRYVSQGQVWSAAREGRIPRAFQRHFDISPQTPRNDPRAVIERYRVERVTADEGMVLTYIPAENGGFPCVFVVTLVVGLALLGVWLARRLRRPGSVAPEPVRPD